MKLQERSKNAKLPSPQKSWLSRDLSRKNAKPAVKFAGSRLRGSLRSMCQYCISCVVFLSVDAYGFKILD